MKKRIIQKLFALTVLVFSIILYFVSLNFTVVCYFCIIFLSLTLLLLCFRNDIKSFNVFYVLDYSHIVHKHSLLRKTCLLVIGFIAFKQELINCHFHALYMWPRFLNY
jgi:hypothetical protein